ncbi:MAG: class I SAM-dependent methyltransferase [Cyclobacteriaceae bacterium]
MLKVKSIGKALKFRYNLIISALIRKNLNDYLLKSIIVDDAKANIEFFEFRNRIEPEHFSYNGFPDFHADEFIQGNHLQQNWSSEKEVSVFLGNLVETLKAQEVWEIGCFVGYTSAHLAQALLKPGYSGNLRCVDANLDFLNITKKNLEKHQLDGCLKSAIHGLSTDQKVLDELPPQADVIFIDASHAYEPTLKELKIFHNRLSEKGCIVLHDAIRWPGVRNAIHDSRNMFDIFTFATSRSNGVSVLFPKKK